MPAKKQKTSLCPICGSPVRYVRPKGMAAIRVEPPAKYIIPQESGEIELVTKGGKLRRGILSSDGIKGYVLHNC